jgi:hypothetical protein
MACRTRAARSVARKKPRELAFRGRVRRFHANRGCIHPAEPWWASNQKLRDEQKLRITARSGSIRHDAASSQRKFKPTAAIVLAWQLSARGVHRVVPKQPKRPSGLRPCETERPFPGRPQRSRRLRPVSFPTLTSRLRPAFISRVRHRSIQ